MTASNNSETPTLNARLSAWTLTASALAGFMLSLQSAALTPLRLMTLAVMTFGIWAFCDEMGMRKPLVRAGFIAYALAALTKSIALIDPLSQAVGRFYLVYVFAMLGALLFWSAAYLHRQRDVKAVGAVGAVISAGPLLALVAGHIALGTGAAFGIGALLAATEGAPLRDLSAIKSIDGIFAIWSLVTAWLLLSGRIRSSAAG